jgi:hypothetical protein
MCKFRSLMPQQKQTGKFCRDARWPPVGLGLVLLPGALLALHCQGRALPSNNPSNLDGGGGGDGMPFSGLYSDFPATPSITGALDPTQGAMFPIAFGTPGLGAAGGPCLTEPTIDAMYPMNFTPPLFEWSAPADQTVYELRLHVENQVNDLVVYTDQTSYTLPAEMWAALATDSSGHDVSITLRSADLQSGMVMGGVLLGTVGNVHIAPVPASGAVVYWTTSGGSALKGFHIGDTTVTTVLTPQLMRNAVSGDDTQCIGCHASSPDGALAFVSRGSNPGSGPFGIDARLVDGSGQRAAPSDVSAAAITQLMTMFQVMPTLSPAHYSASDAVLLSLWNGGSGMTYQLIFTDLHSGATGTLQRTGDLGQPDAPSFSHDGTSVVYDSVTNGSIAIFGGAAATDIYTVPYNSQKGGTAAALPGASDPNYNEYYPTYSPLDTLIAYNRIAAGGVVYNAPDAEVFVIPRQGGTGTRLSANDPPACGGLMSPGLTNSWPRWAPTAPSSGTQRYYWMIFSSKRRPAVQGMVLPQLYLAAVVTDISGGTETIAKTYPAIYITTQVPTESNHTPAWDEFMISPPG